MKKAYPDQRIFASVAAILAVGLMVWFPISFGSDDSTDTQAAKHNDIIVEQSVKLDSLQLLLRKFCEVKNCSLDMDRSFRRSTLHVRSLNDKTDLLGKDWRRLVPEYRSSLCEIMVTDEEVAFNFKRETLAGVEYVTLPLHILHALAEL